MDTAVNCDMYEALKSESPAATSYVFSGKKTSSMLMSPAVRSASTVRHLGGQSLLTHENDTRKGD